MTIDYEDNAIFLPNVESTRLMQNTIADIDTTLPISPSEMSSNDNRGKISIFMHIMTGLGFHIE